MYIEQILWVLSWPVLIWLSYQLVKVALKKFEKNEKAEEATTAE